MSIEAIKEALAAEPIDYADFDTYERLDFLRNKRDYLANLAAACNPVAIRSLIERLEAAEKDAERYRWLRDKASMATAHIATPDGSIHYGSGADAVVDSAMESGGLAEGVSDGRGS